MRSYISQNTLLSGCLCRCRYFCPSVDSRTGHNDEGDVCFSCVYLVGHCGIGVSGDGSGLTAVVLMRFVTSS